ncbi:MAG: DUF2442 domain-containing protein [Candidatus Sumerlaeia bacterium]|nr:DUF2442 domain-containing protein [Candidatus Sumerlaeia bacterium]
MNPRVSQVHPGANYCLALRFTNGESGIYDCSGLLEIGVFRELTDEEYFRQASVLDGTVAWPNGQDICPDTLYLDSLRPASAHPCSM